MKIEKDAVTFEMPDADFVAKFGMQAAADMVLDLLLKVRNFKLYTTARG